MTYDRAMFRAARTAGLRTRHRRRLANAQQREAEHELCERCGYPLDGQGHGAYCDTEMP